LSHCFLLHLLFRRNHFLSRDSSVGGNENQGIGRSGSAPFLHLGSTSDVPIFAGSRTLVSDLHVSPQAQLQKNTHSLSERVGGILVKSQTNGAQNATRASIVVRVPAARFAEVAVEIRKLGVRVENEEIHAEDMTRHYVISKRTCGTCAHRKRST